MESVNLTAQSSSSGSTTPAGTEKSQTTQDGKATAATTSTPQATTATISGKAMMLSRLFHTEDPNAAPPVQTQTTIYNKDGLVYRYLNTEDRDFISGLYEYANKNGIDPAQVDNVAFDLAIYRSYGPGGPPDTSGEHFNEDGTPFIDKFNDHDEAIAQRILTSKAMNDTQVDHGFIQAVLNPNRSSHVHAESFDFLQQVVFAYSASGSDGSADPNAKPVVRPKASDFPKLDMSQFKTSTTANPDAEGLPDDLAAKIHPMMLHYLTDGDKAALSLAYDKEMKNTRDPEKSLDKLAKLAMKTAAGRLQEELLKKTSGDQDKRQDEDGTALKHILDTSRRVESLQSPSSATLADDGKPARPDFPPGPAYSQGSSPSTQSSRGCHWA